LVVTTQEKLIRLPDDSKASLEAAALLDEPFFIPWLIDLGFSVNGLNPLFDAGILREVFSDQAVFANSELRSRLLEQMPWSKKGNSVGALESCSVSAVIPLTRQPIFSAGLTVMLMPGHVVPERPKTLVTATKRPEAFNGQRHNVNPNCSTLCQDRIGSRGESF
jgi:hypothetical protein